MADNNRPAGRQRNISGQGSGVYRRGAGTGSGPVGNSGGYSGRGGNSGRSGGGSGSGDSGNSGNRGLFNFGGGSGG